MGHGLKILRPTTGRMLQRPMTKCMGEEFGRSAKGNAVLNSNGRENDGGEGKPAVIRRRTFSQRLRERKYRSNGGLQ